MSCDECQALLDQYVEDELHDQTARSLAAHMTKCRECASAHEALRREHEIYASYLRNVEPSPGLWASLRLELEKEKVKASQPQPRERWLAIALGRLHVTPQLATALVLLIIGLAIGILVWRTTLDAPRQQAQNPKVGVPASSEVNLPGTNPTGDNTDRRGSAHDNDRKIRPFSPNSGDRGREIQVSGAGHTGRRVIERSPAVPTVDQIVRRAEQQYLSAIEILSRDIKRRRPALSPELLSQLETALAEVDGNIAATRKVARERPRDPVAVQYLALAYEKKVELLREVTSR